MSKHQLSLLEKLICCVAQKLPAGRGRNHHWWVWWLSKGLPVSPVPELVTAILIMGLVITATCKDNKHRALTFKQRLFLNLSICSLEKFQLYQMHQIFFKGILDWQSRKIFPFSKHWCVFFMWLFIYVHYRFGSASLLVNGVSFKRKRPTTQHGDNWEVNDEKQYKLFLCVFATQKSIPQKQHVLKHFLKWLT